MIGQIKAVIMTRLAQCKLWEISDQHKLSDSWTPASNVYPNAPAPLIANI